MTSTATTVKARNLKAGDRFDQRGITYTVESVTQTLPSIVTVAATPTLGRARSIGFYAHNDITLR